MAQRKLLTLDGLRGVAALTVLFWHNQDLGVERFASGYLAVDLFFLMSGFVIALSYERKLLDDLSFGTFVLIRLKRLYPLYILGTLLALAYVIVAQHLTNVGHPMAPQQITIATVLAVFYIPMKQADIHQAIFPLNPPAWSLFLEIAVNIIYALIARRLSNQALIALVVVSALGMLGHALAHPSMDVGWTWATLLGGTNRVFFSFFAGVLAYRYRDRLPRLVVPTPALLAATLILLALPTDVPFAKALTLVTILAGFPLIMVAAVQNEPVRLARAFALTGAVSYPLYALQSSIVLWTFGAAKAFHLSPAEQPWLGWVILALVVLGAWLALKFFDEPLRQVLRRQQVRREAQPAIA